MLDYIVIGGGIGGCSAAALLHAHGYDTLLLEKESYLGGCASTFTHKGVKFNTGATTVAGYGENGLLKKICEEIGVNPLLEESNPAMTILHNNFTFNRTRSLFDVITEINHIYPHPKHEQFWNIIFKINNMFYAHNITYYYSNRSWIKKAKSLLSFIPFVKDFYPYLFKNGYKAIKEIYGDIPPLYLDFLEAQILIVAQSSLKNINFLTAILSLGYTFQPTHYPVGGMGSICDTLVSKMGEKVIKKNPVHTIKLQSDGTYLVSTKTETFHSKNIIMGTTHYDSARFFDDKRILKYYDSYKTLNNFQSAFVVYIQINNEVPLHHHYQIITEHLFPFSISKALFISVSDSNDGVLSKKHYRQITASLHTDSRIWEDISKEQYHQQKMTLQTLLQDLICDRLCLKKEDITLIFSATPSTFKHFIGRSQLGGNAMTLKNFLPLMPSNDTPIIGLYHVGDTSFAGQGWPGVLMGVNNLMRLINE